jgi:hypothetical protein
VPNSIGRRRGGENTEVEQLKKELEELKANYARDITLIGSDIRALDSRIPAEAPTDNTAVEASTDNTPAA